jgi:hypothetical protein
LDLLQALKLGLFFSLHLFQGYPLKKSIQLPKHFKFQTPTTYLHPTETLNLTTTQEQKWCWSDAAEDNVAKVVLKWCCRR